MVSGPRTLEIRNGVETPPKLRGRLGLALKLSGVRFRLAVPKIHNQREHDGGGSHSENGKHPQTVHDATSTVEAKQAPHVMWRRHDFQRA